MGAGDSYSWAVNALYDRLDRNSKANRINAGDLLMKQYQLETARRGLTRDDQRQNALSGINTLEDIPDAVTGMIRAGDVAGAGNLLDTYSKMSSRDDKQGLENARKQEELLKISKAAIPFLRANPSSYPVVRNDLLQMGMSPKVLPDPATFRSNEDLMRYLDQADQALAGYSDRMRAATPSYHNIQQGDETVSLRTYPGGREEVVGRGPRFKQSGKDTAADTYRTLVAKRESGEDLTQEEVATIKAYETEKSIGAFARSNAPISQAEEILAQEVAEGNLAPSQLAKRTGNYNAILARAKEINPDLNIKQSDMDFSAGRTAGFRKGAIAIKAMPEILQKTADAGKKLDLSNIKFVGKLEAWTKGQLNDPDFTHYMTLRNDALLTIASVMRGVAATDQAHRVEMEAASPTLSPRALDAWLQGQMESLEPRLKEYQGIYGTGSAGGGGSKKSVVRTGTTKDGRKVIQYSDGSIRYAE